jgi:hypothetical protein
LLACLALHSQAQQPDPLWHSLPPPAGSAQTNGQLGYAVATDGNYAVVGAPFDDLAGVDSGVVKVFDATTGALLHVLPNPTPAADDRFGWSTAISGTRVVVGAHRDGGAGADAGSVYVYDLASAAPAVPVATFSGTQPGGWFGYAVAISGTKVVVGAARDDTGAIGAGSAYVYDLDSPTQTVPVETLHNPDPGADDRFGWSVGISETRMVVGTYSDDTGTADAGSAYVYDLAAETPSVPVETLNLPNPATSDRFGYAVSIAGTRVVVGAFAEDTGGVDSGSVYVYELTNPTPKVPVHIVHNPEPSAGDSFGVAVSISGSRMVIGTYADDTGATDAGSAYVYDLLNPTPTVPVATFNNPGPADSDNFGLSVAISSTRIVVGAYGDDTSASGAGSAYVYEVGAGTATVPIATLNNPGPAAGDRFGWALGISGTRVVVGAYRDDAGANDAGSAFVYDLASPTPIVPVATLRNPAPAANDQYGYSVAISGTWVIVGAPFDDTAAGNAGSVYLYDLANGNSTVPVFAWSNPSGAAAESFGFSVAISGTQAVVGTPFAHTGASAAGRAYVFDVAGESADTPIAILNNPSPAANDVFGKSVAISGDRVLVGAESDDTGAVDAGSAYFYNLESVTPTAPVHALHNPDPAEGDNFGNAVAISGTRAVVGAYRDRTGEIGGVAFVYDLASGAPTVPLAILNNPTPEANDHFGASVAISGARAVVGASQDDAGADNAGVAHVYEVTSDAPTVPVLTLTSPERAAGDQFGFAVAIDAPVAAVGSPFSDRSLQDKGYAHTFHVAPEIQVEAPLATILTSGAVPLNFGMQLVDGGLPVDIRHRITNTGPAPLTGLVLTIVGPALADFVPSAQPPATLAPQATFEFDVRFDPTATGRERRRSL